MRACSVSRTSRRPTSPSCMPATSGSSPRPAAWPRGSARRPARSCFRASRPTARRLAYSANYDGNLDVYVVASLGGEPVRLTHHPMDDRVVGWHPDGKRVLFASSRESRAAALQPVLSRRRSTGGLPEKLPVPYGEFGVVLARRQRRSPTCRMSQDFRTWKRYRGGWAPDIWLFNLQDVRGAQRHEQRGQRRIPDVARGHALLPVRSRQRRAPEHLGARHRRRTRCGR